MMMTTTSSKEPKLSIEDLNLQELIFHLEKTCYIKLIIAISCMNNFKQQWKKSNKIHLVKMKERMIIT